MLCSGVKLLAEWEQSLQYRSQRARPILSSAPFANAPRLCSMYIGAAESYDNLSLSRPVFQNDLLMYWKQMQ